MAQFVGSICWLNLLAQFVFFRVSGYIWGMETTETKDKDRVCAYFGEWAGRDINPKNGIRIAKCPHSWLLSQDLRTVMEVEKDLTHLSYLWFIAARILKLDKPQAKAIEWNSNGDGKWVSDCVAYFIDMGDDGYTAFITPHPQCLVHVFPEFKQAEKACQDDKQRRYDEMGGYA